MLPCALRINILLENQPCSTHITGILSLCGNTKPFLLGRCILWRWPEKASLREISSVSLTWCFHRFCTYIIWTWQLPAIVQLKLFFELWHLIRLHAFWSWCGSKCETCKILSKHIDFNNQFGEKKHCDQWYSALVKYCVNAWFKLFKKAIFHTVLNILVCINLKFGEISRENFSDGMKARYKGG